VSQYRSLPLALAVCCGLAATAFAEPVQVGAAVDVDTVTPIAALLAAPSDFAGQVVRVEGEVRGVCTRMGCWIDLGDEAGNRVRVKVEDGVLVFPADSVGKPATAQGTVTIQEMAREQYVAWQQHLVEEGGEPFDESTVGPGPIEVVQIAGTGATIGD
jgi:hypothetical protein